MNSGTIKALKDRDKTKPAAPAPPPSEQMCDRARGFILGLDLDCRTWAAMRNHLCAGGYETLTRIEQLAESDPKGHITKWDVAECIYLLMTTPPEQSKEGGGE